MAGEDNEINELVETLIKKGNAKAAAGESEEAKELLEQAVELAPGSYRAWDVLGFVRWSLGDIEGAEDCNRRSLKIKPLNAYAHKGLGICLADQGKLDDGVAELHHAMALKPLWVDPVHDLAVVLFRNERYEDALRWLREALKMDSKLAGKLKPLIEEAEARLSLIHISEPTRPTT